VKTLGWHSPTIGKRLKNACENVYTTLAYSPTSCAQNSLQSKTWENFGNDNESVRVIENDFQKANVWF
jgi:hypothetical protein